MKKIFLACITIVTMMLCMASPFFVKPINANATGDFTGFTVEPEPILEDLCSTDTLPQKYKTIEQITSYLAGNSPIQNDDYFISFVGFYRDMYYYTIALCFSSADVTFDNGILTISNATSHRQDNKGFCYYCDWYQGSNSDTGIQILPFTYAQLDFNTNSYTINNGDTYAHINFSRYTCSKTWRIYSNIPDTLSNGGLNIDVIFNPELAGVVTRSSVTDNGVSKLSDYFTMDITNNSNFAIQYKMMFVTGPGEYGSGSYSYFHQGDTDYFFQPDWQSGFSVNDDGSFVFVNDEWIYCSPTVGGGVAKFLKPSEWHYIGAGESIHQDFSWSQFNFEKERTYHALVYALPTNLDCATALDGSHGGLYSNYGDYCLDFTTTCLVYDTVFYITNPAVFNPNDDSFGNKIKNSNFSGDRYQYSAMENPSNGSLVFSNGSVQDVRDLPNTVSSGGSHGGGGYYSGHSSVSSSGSYSSGSYSASNNFGSLNGQFSSFFNFLNSALGAFPSAFLTIITAGFSGLVILGLVKVAFK